MADAVTIENERLLHTAPKNDRERLTVRTYSIAGRAYLDLRWFAVRESGELLPTKKGIAVPIAMLGELGNALKKARASVGLAGA